MEAGPFMSSVMGTFTQDLGRKINFYSEMYEPPPPPPNPAYEYMPGEPLPRPPPPNSRQVYQQKRAAAAQQHRVRFAKGTKPAKSRGRGRGYPAV